MKQKLTSASAGYRPYLHFIRQRATLVCTIVIATIISTVSSFAQGAKKPNILIIWGDDIGGFNISAYNQGMMGYKTPNIDRIAKESALFTDWYGQQNARAVSHEAARNFTNKPKNSVDETSVHG